MELSERESTLGDTTDESEEQEQYAIDGILAERLNDRTGMHEYLTKWEGYPVERSTWEVEANFDQPETIAEWHEKKARQVQGLELAFDVKEWNRRVFKWNERKDKRKRQRREKRLKKLANFSGDSQDHSDADDGKPLGGVVPKKRLVAPRRRQQQTSSGSEQESRRPSVTRQDDIDKHRLSSNIVVTRRITSNVQESGQQVVGKKPEETRLSITSNSTSMSRPKLDIYNSLKPARKKEVAKLGAKGRGPGRPTRERVDGADIFKNWDSTPNRKRTTASMIDRENPGQNAIPYKLASKRRQQERYLRDERPPDAASLTLHDPKTGKTVEAKNVLQGRKYSEGLKNTRPTLDKDGDTLFVDQVVESPIDNDLEMVDADTSLPTRRASEPKAPAIQTSSTHQTLKNVHGAPNASIDSIQKVSHDLWRPAHSPAVQSQDQQVGRAKQTVSIQSSPQVNFEDLIGDYDLVLNPLNTLSDSPKHDSDIWGTIVMRQDSGPIETNTIFRGLTVSVKYLFLKIKKYPRDVTVYLKDESSFVQYWEKYHNSGYGYHGAGHIVPWHDKREPITQIYDRLNLRGHCAIFHCKFFVLVVYPSGHRAWEAFDGRYASGPQNGVLRFFVRTNIEASSKHPDASKIFSEDPAMLPQKQPPAETRAHRDSQRVDHVTVRPKSPKFQKQTPQLSSNLPLLSNRGSTSRVNSASEIRPETGSSSAFVSANKVDTDILHSVKPENLQPSRPLDSPNNNGFTSQSLCQSDSHWADSVMALSSNHTPQTLRQFIEKVFGIEVKDLLKLANGKTLNRRVMFLHFPEGKEKKKEKEIMKTAFSQAEYLEANVFDSDREWSMYLNLPSGIVMIHESVSLNTIPELSKILLQGDHNIFTLRTPDSAMKVGGHIKPIFPKGLAFLVLDSMVLKQPSALYDIFFWYRRTYKNENKKGTWKFVTRPGFRTWLMDLAEDRKQVSEKSAKTYKNLFVQLDLMCPLEDMDESEDYEAPLPHACYWSVAGRIDGYHDNIGTGDRRDDDAALLENDQILAVGFGKWTLQNADKHRKFFIITPPPDKSEIGKASLELHKNLSMSLQHVNVLDSKQFREKNSIDKFFLEYEAEQKRKKQKGAGLGTPKEPVTPASPQQK